MRGRHFHISRRDFCSIAGGAVASLALGTACRRTWSNLRDDGRLTVRPQHPGKSSVSGRANLGLDNDRDAILQVPKSQATLSFPLLLFLHGAGQSAEDMFDYLGSAPDDAGVAVLAPNSREYTWDAIIDSFGPDVEFLNLALARVFELTTIDASRIAVGGFSDGATYAISLGLINGDFFRRVAAFSPGFVIDGSSRGQPSFFISHGTQDHILPIDTCGRKIAGSLRARGYEVTYREFDGDHEIPADVAREGLRWAAG
jgi:phospholipase/carboxylesterase